MKKLLKIALAAFLACVCALSLIACNASDEVTGGGDNANGGYKDDNKDNTGGNTDDPTDGNTGGNAGGEETLGIDKNLTFPVVSVNFTDGAPTKLDAASSRAISTSHTISPLLCSFIRFHLSSSFKIARVCACAPLRGKAFSPRAGRS